MSIFADSSALVKRYADEDRSTVVPALEGLTISALARVEVPAGLWRKQRTGEMTAGQVVLATRELEADLFGDAAAPPRFAIVAVGPSILDSAARLASVHGLPAYDAVQLASALAAQVSDFACFDEALGAAAASEGLRILPER